MSAPEDGPARLLLAHSERIARETLARDLAREGYKVRATASYDTLWQWVRAGEADIVLLDVDMADPARNGFEFLRQIRRRRPRLPVLVLSAENTVLTALLAARFGAFDYFPKPYSFAQLAAATTRALHQAGAESQRKDARTRLPLIGTSAPMQAVFRLIGQAARSDLPVLLSGETGTGKSLVAKLVHDYGERAKAGFASVHFPLADAAFAPAWTQAVKAAGTGSLVLENIGALSLHQQALALSAITGLGEGKGGPRLMATMGLDEAGQGNGIELRHDLLFRLNTLQIDLPPLRRRGEDAAALAQDFVTRFSQGSKNLDKSALRALAGHPWPGNVRELRNLVQRAVLMSPADVLGAEELFGPPVRDSTGQALEGGKIDKAMARLLAQWLDDMAKTSMPDDLYSRALAALERPLLQQVMALSSGNQLKAARLLGINRNTLHKKLKHHGLLRQ